LLKLATDFIDQTALQIALETGHTEALKVLLDHSSTVTAQLPKDDYLRSPATRGHLRMLEMLLEHIPRDQQLLNGGLLVWDWMASVAVSAGNVETVQFFLDQGLPFSDPLHDAAHRGRPEVARLLVEGVKQLDISARSEKWNDMTAMDLAAKYGNVNMIEQLLDYGAEVDCVAEDGMQPIHHAAECGEADAVVCLVQKGADVDAKSDYGLTPIHLATCEDNYSALEALIAMGGDVNATDNDGHAALYYTTKAFDLEQPFRTLRYNVAGSRGVDLAWLLLRNGADPEHKDCIGWTAMDAAVRSGRIGLARTLLMARTIEGIENVPDTLEALYNCLVDMERDDDWLN